MENYKKLTRLAHFFSFLCEWPVVAVAGQKNAASKKERRLSYLFLPPLPATPTVPTLSAKVCASHATRLKRFSLLSRRHESPRAASCVYSRANNISVVLKHNHEVYPLRVCVCFVFLLLARECMFCVRTCGNPLSYTTAHVPNVDVKIAFVIYPCHSDKTQREINLYRIFISLLSLSMVKQQKIVRDAGGPSKVPAVVISAKSWRKRAQLNCRIRRKVLRMLSQKHPEVETEGEPGAGSAKGGGGRNDNGAVTPGSYANGEGSKEFLSTGRTGRRNAMPDILGHHADTGTADLSTRLEALTTDTKHDQPGTSDLGEGEASTSQ